MRLLKSLNKRLNLFLIAVFLLASMVGAASFISLKTSSSAYAAGESYTVTYNLTGINIVDQESHMTATNGVDFAIDMDIDFGAGYVELDHESISVMIGGSVSDAYTFDSYNGTLIISGDAITGDIEISCRSKMTPTIYSVEITSSSAIVESDLMYIERFGQVGAKFSAPAGSILYPAPYEIAVGGVSLLDNPEAYTYDRSTGTVVLKNQYVTGNVEIIWNAQPLVLKTFFSRVTSDQEDIAITLGQEISFTVTAEKFYELPDTIAITYATSDGEFMAEEDFIWDKATGRVTIPADKVTDVLCVHINGSQKVAHITYNLTDTEYSAYAGSITYDPLQVLQGNTWYVVLNPIHEDYRLLKDQIVIKINGVVLENIKENYEVASTSNRLWIKSGIIDGDIEITAKSVTTTINITYDLNRFTIDSAPTTWTYNTTGLNMILTYVEDIGYSKPANTDREYFKVIADGVELTSGWSISSSAYKLTLNKAATLCSELKIVARAIPTEYTINIKQNSIVTTSVTQVTYTRETVEDPMKDVIISVKKGYALSYWRITVTSIISQTSWQDGSTYTWVAGSYGSISLNPAYQTNNYNINFSAGLHGSTSITRGTYKVTSSSFTLPVPTPDEHYTFVKWQITSTDADSSWVVGEDFAINSSGNYGNVDVTAIYELTRYTITLDPLFGSLTGPTVFYYTVETETMQDLETPTAPAQFVFTKWVIQEPVGSWTAGDYVWGGVGSYGDVVVVAQYEEVKYTITFVAGEHGTYDMTPIEYTAGQPTIVLPTIDIDDHWEFDAWKVVESDGSWDQESIFIYSPSEYGNITLRPDFMLHLYTINLEVTDFGNLSNTYYHYTYLDTTMPTLETPTTLNDGYEFACWQVKESVGSWVAGETFSWKAENYGDVTLTAVYNALQSQYTIEYWTETLSGDSYELLPENIVVGSGTTWNTITETPADLRGFTFNSTHKDNVLTHTLQGYGTEVYVLFYDRDTYTIKYTLTNLTEQSATVYSRVYDPYSTLYGEPFYVYLQPNTDDYHLNVDYITFKVDGVEDDVTFTKAATSNRLFFEAGSIAGDLEIIAEGRLNAFDITYELTGVEITEDGETDYTKIEYKTGLKIPLTLLWDSVQYTYPTTNTVQVYVDDVLIETGYAVSTAGGYIQLYQAAAVGDIKIVASAAYREYTVTINADEPITIKYNVTTNIELPDHIKDGYTLTHYTFVANSYNAAWQTRFGGTTIETFEVGTGMTGNVTLTPRYEIITYKLTFKAGTHGNGSPVDYDYNIELTTLLSDLPVFEAAQGYRFDKWVITHSNGSWTVDEDFEWQPGNYGHATITAMFVGRDDTQYVVRHYYENLQGGFIQDTSKTQRLQGVTDSLITADVLTKTGYVFDDTNTQNATQGVIAANGSLVLKVYYRLTLHEIAFVSDNTAYGNVDINKAEGVKYGTPITVQGNQVVIGTTLVSALPTQQTATHVYNFVEWQGLQDTVEENLTITATFARDVRYYTIIFKDGDTVITTQELTYNEKPVYDGEIPTRQNTEKVKYTFDGWTIEGASQVYTSLPAVVDDTVFVAHFAVETTPEPTAPAGNNMMIIYIAAGGGAVVLIVTIIIIVAVKKRKKGF